MNNTIKYLRNTHDANGNYRRELDEVWDKIPSPFSGVIHLMDSQKPMSATDIMVASHEYAAQFPLENNAKFETDPDILQPILDLLENFGMVVRYSS